MRKLSLINLEKETLQKSETAKIRAGAQSEPCVCACICQPDQDAISYRDGRNEANWECNNPG